MIGIQIADVFARRRVDRLCLPSLCRYDALSRYWYSGGYSPARASPCWPDRSAL
ncbi:hypothetical protein [Pseudogemmobacter humi]|uniref:hypothetical protein n=1 Tax=Pseudogemmobacter humi TaxID=2483812 RepID=UPI001356911D|nr:hypothetical protein [Pseudogemmobacter humi]